MGLLDRLAAADAIATTVVAMSSVVTAGVIVFASALSDPIGLAAIVLLGLAAAGVSRYVYRNRLARIRLLRKA